LVGFPYQFLMVGPDRCLPPSPPENSLEVAVRGVCMNCFVVWGIVVGVLVRGIVVGVAGESCGENLRPSCPEHP